MAICAVTFCSVALAIVFSFAAAVVTVSSIFAKKMSGVAKGKLITFALVFLLAMGVTSLTYMRVENRKIYSRSSVIEGSVAMLTQSDGEGKVLTDGLSYIYIENVSVDGRKIDGVAQTHIASSRLAEGLKIGDRIKFEGDISPKNLVVTDSYSINDYKRNVYHYISCDSNTRFEYLGNSLKFSDKIKLKIKSVLQANVRSETAGFLYAMTLGDKSGLEENIQSAFQRTGAAHIFAVSGLHVGIIAASLLRLLKKLRLRNSLVRLLVVAAVLIPFCMLSGSPSTVRATVMTLVALGAKVIMMRSDGISNVSFAGCAILIANPLYLFDVGFLMSFLAIFGLLTLAEPIGKLFPKRFPKKLAALLFATVSVNIALLPVMIMYFGGQTLLSVIANIIVIPLASIFFPIYLVALILASVLPFAGALLTVAGAPFTLMIRAVGKIGEWETPVVYFQSGGVFIVLTILIAVLLSKYVFLDKKVKKAVAAALAVCLCLGVVCNVARFGSENAVLYCYADKNETQYAFIENVKGGRYLIVNGDVTSESISSAVEIMSVKGFAKADGIALVGDGFDSERVAMLAQRLNCSTVYYYGASGFETSGLISKDYVIEDGMTLAFSNCDCLDIVAGGTVIRTLAKGSTLPDSDYDVLLSYEAQYTPDEGQYIVCSAGYINSLQNYLPTAFTFRLKNGKILIGQNWRY